MALPSAPPTQPSERLSTASTAQSTGETVPVAGAVDSRASTHDSGAAKRRKTTPSIDRKKASTTAAAGGVLDVAKAAFLAAAGSAGAGGQNGGDDNVGMAGDLPAMEQPGSDSKELAPTQEAFERERQRVEIERRKAKDAVAARDAAEESGRKACEANEKLEKEVGTVKAGIARALTENGQYLSKARRVTLPRRCREKAQEPDQPKEMA
ncbi:unnamed protein product, partial [Ectocarpus sp. 12 AP-2014]